MKEEDEEEEEDEEKVHPAKLFSSIGKHFYSVGEDVVKVL